MDRKIVNIISSVVILIAVFGVGYALGSPAHDHSPNFEDRSGVVGVFVNNGERLEVFDVEAEEGMSVFEVMEQAQATEQLVFEHEDYGGELGAFIESINGAGGVGNAWWQFWINTSYSTTGVSNAQVGPGDIVYFSLTDEEYEASN